MMIFKHKTRKTSFRNHFAVIAFLRIIVLVSFGLILMTIPNSSAVENVIQTLHTLFS
jgi:competence protein ComGC